MMYALSRASLIIVHLTGRGLNKKGRVLRERGGGAQICFNKVIEFSVVLFPL